jgi:hypothetical protein
MQIFATNTDPAECARILDDARVRKMLTETAQLLSTAARALGLDDSVCNLYKSVNQGRALWTWAMQPDAFAWLCQHGLALETELDRRELSVGKFIRTRDVLANCRRISGLLGGDYTLATDFVNATRQQRDNVDFRHIADPHLAYRLYLTTRWEIQQRDPRVHLRPRWAFPASPPGWALSN